MRGEGGGRIERGCRELSQFFRQEPRFGDREGGCIDLLMCTEVLRCGCLIYSSFFAGRVGEGVVVDQPLLVGWILSCRSILGVFFVFFVLVCVWCFCSDQPRFSGFK